MESLRLTTTIPATPEGLYDAWLSGDSHAAMTGSPAASEERQGGTFTAWDGYITGKHLELEPGRRLVQAWRTREFPDKSPPSRLEIRFSKVPQGNATRVTLLQSDIPDGQSEMYSETWQDNYFEPIARYFA